MLNSSFSIHLAISLGLKASLSGTLSLTFIFPATCTQLKQWYSVMSDRNSVLAIKILPEFYQQYIK